MTDRSNINFKRKTGFPKGNELHLKSIALNQVGDRDTKRNSKWFWKDSTKTLKRPTSSNSKKATARKSVKEINIKLQVDLTSNPVGSFQNDPIAFNHKKIQVDLVSNPVGSFQNGPIAFSHKKVQVDLASNPVGSLKNDPKALSHKKVQVDLTSNRVGSLQNDPIVLRHKKVQVDLTSNPVGNFRNDPIAFTQNIRVDVTSNTTGSLEKDPIACSLKEKPTITVRRTARKSLNGSSNRYQLEALGNFSENDNVCSEESRKDLNSGSSKITTRKHFKTSSRYNHLNDSRSQAGKFRQDVSKVKLADHANYRANNSTEIHEQSIQSDNDSVDYFMEKSPSDIQSVERINLAKNTARKSLGKSVQIIQLDSLTCSLKDFIKDNVKIFRPVKNTARKTVEYPNRNIQLKNLTYSTNNFRESSIVDTRKSTKSRKNTARKSFNKFGLNASSCASECLQNNTSINFRTARTNNLVNSAIGRTSKSSKLENPTVVRIPSKQTSTYLCRVPIISKLRRSF